MVIYSRSLFQEGALRSLIIGFVYAIEPGVEPAVCFLLPVTSQMNHFERYHVVEWLVVVALKSDMIVAYAKP